MLQRKNSKTISYDRIDKKTIRKTGMCLDCLQKFELKLKLDGTYPFYEDYKITKINWHMQEK